MSCKQCGVTDFYPFFPAYFLLLIAYGCWLLVTFSLWADNSLERKNDVNEGDSSSVVGGYGISISNV
jgi:hypothetical protein